MSALPVLYSFRRCPYAMRARLALAVSGQVCELREVVLRNKPQGLLQASPKATVPVLVLPGGQVLDQSLAIMRWALERHDPGRWLHPSHGALADMLALIAECDGPFKHALDRCKYPSRYPEADTALASASAMSSVVRPRRLPLRRASRSGDSVAIGVCCMPPTMLANGNASVPRSRHVGDKCPPGRLARPEARPGRLVRHRPSLVDPDTRWSPEWAIALTPWTLGACSARERHPP